MFSLESPHRGNSNEYKRYTIFNMNKKDTTNYPNSAAMGFFSKGLKCEFETAVVNEPSVFELLKFYCSVLSFQLSYDLGTFFFYQEAYHQALEMFKETKDLLKHVSIIRQKNSPTKL